MNSQSIQKPILCLIILCMALISSAQDTINNHRPDGVSDEKWESLQVVIQESKLLPESSGIGGENSRFGYSLSVDGNRALIGAIFVVETGVVYVMDYDGITWKETAILKPDDGQSNDQFGSSVSLSGNRALIGAVGDDDKGTNSGSVYVFEFDSSGWNQKNKLTATEGIANSNFGGSVNQSGNLALISASSQSTGGPVYYFEFKEGLWTQRQILMTDLGETLYTMNNAITISGNRALIGVYGGNKAYIYDFNGSQWIQSHELNVENNGDSWFGYSVSLVGNRALVGAQRGINESGVMVGFAYIFEFNGKNWIESQKLIAEDAVFGDFFGSRVSLSENRALISAVGVDDYGFNSGAAYIFDFDGKDWSQSKKIVDTDGGGSDYLGSSLGLYGDIALIGVYQDDDFGRQSGAVFVYDYDGIDWSESQKISTGDGAALDSFGFSVSLFGDRALVGAYSDDDKGAESGSAYIFDYDGSNWSMTQKLLASDGESGDFFGYSLSLSKNRALIGAYNDDNESGSAYMFNYNGSSWIETQKLTASDASENDYFGFSLSLYGDLALIGANQDSDIATEAGSAYVFEFDGSLWVESQKLTINDAMVYDSFGYSVSLNNNRALIGAYGHTLYGRKSGSAYIFDFDGNSWVQSQELIANRIQQYDRYGASVSLFEDRALIGAFLDDENSFQSGAVYVFDYDGQIWSQSQKLKSSDAAASDAFGRAVSLSANRALIGAYVDDDNGNATGSAYVFEFNNDVWSQAQKITTIDSSSNDRFGRSVSLSGNRVMVGTYLDDDYGTDSGASYIYTLNSYAVDKVFYNSFETDQSAPILEFSASPTNISLGGSSQLSWFLSNTALICTKSGDWSGLMEPVEIANGSHSYTISNITSDATYSIVCANSYGASEQKSVTIIVN